MRTVGSEVRFVETVISVRDRGHWKHEKNLRLLEHVSPPIKLHINFVYGWLCAITNMLSIQSFCFFAQRMQILAIVHAVVLLCRPTNCNRPKI